MVKGSRAWPCLWLVKAWARDNPHSQLVLGSFGHAGRNQEELVQVGWVGLLQPHIHEHAYSMFEAVVFLSLQGSDLLPKDDLYFFLLCFDKH